MIPIYAKRSAEQGAAALIVVVFSVLLLVTVSLGFIRLVVQDQQRTINDELARGAYDAALAGVEDGKRVLKACLNSGNTDACNALSTGECHTVHIAKILSDTDDASNHNEVLLQDSTGLDRGFDQAYTCVKVQRNTDTYQRTINADSSLVVPLETAGPFTELALSWFVNPGGTPVDLGTNGTLPTVTGWSPAGTVRPPILRVQLMQYRDGSFNLSDFDASGGGSTLYLYPSTAGASTTLPLSFASDGRATGADLLKAVECDASRPLYICSTGLTLPLPVGGAVNERKAYLRLTSIYGNTDISLQATSTQFQDVQPAIDSTGRASDVFRRVNARVESLGTSLYPRATVDITNNFCKTFSVTLTSYDPGLCDYTGP